MKKSLQLILLFIILVSPLWSQRNMEQLRRGVVAIKTTSNSAFISWRLLGTEPRDIGFNIYRLEEGGIDVKLNSSVLLQGTNYTDATADFTKNNTYYVKPVINDIEQEASEGYTLLATQAVEPCLVVPLKTGDYIHFVWVGDLNADGEYDYIIDRLGEGCKVEAYLNDGTYLWTIDMGPNSLNMDNISPGSSTIDVGNWDGLTVYDMDNDGKAEILLRTANGVVFGDSQTLSHGNNNTQFVSVVDGFTGAEITRTQIPNNYISVGPMACSMGIGYLNGITPSLLTFHKNRNSDGSFNRLMCAWDFNGSTLQLKWNTNMPFGNSYGTGSDGHQMRIVDVDGDGKDDVAHVGFVLNGEDGSLKYNMGDQGIEHGDRWFVAKLDPYRPGLQGYGIQQYNSILDYYYDAADGSLIWKHVTSDGSVGDVGRGVAADIDANHIGYEVWHFGGVYNARENKNISSSYPYPNLRIWWDGDLLSENLNDGKLDKHNVGRLLTAWQYHGASGSARAVPKFYGDIFGDWREEIIYTNSTNSELVIFTTPTPSEHRLYTLPHNPAYRNSMTIKGYMQSHMVDYYLGAGMTTPPTPPIQTAKCIWKGDMANNTWDSSTSNWNINGTDGTYTQGDDVLFDISGQADSIKIDEDITPLSIKMISPLDYVFSGNGEINGSTGLLKAGNGSLSSNCALLYTGETIIEEGSLFVNDTIHNSNISMFLGTKLGGSGVIKSQVSINDHAYLAPGEKENTGTLTFTSDFSIPNYTTLEIDITDDATGEIRPSDKIIVEGNLTLGSNLTININHFNNEINPGSYPILTYTGTLNGSISNIEINNLLGFKYSLINIESTLTLVIEGARDPETIVWNGTSNNWDLQTTLSWNLNNEEVHFVANDSVIFNDEGADKNMVYVNDNLPVGDITFNNSNVDYTISGTGNISGDASLIKNGTGMASVYTSNSYTGKTIINGGTLKVNSIAEAGENSSIGANPSTEASELVLNDATLMYNSSKLSLTNKGLTLGKSKDTISVSIPNSTLIVQGKITGTGDLVKTGYGTLTLQKSINNYSGNTTISNGTILLGDETANAGGLSSGSITFERGTLTMAHGGYTEFNQNMIVDGTGTLNTDDRCNYRGRLTGSGTFNVNLTGTIDRTIFFGDWSDFNGTINVSGVSGANFRIANSYGYENATFDLGDNINMYHGGTGTSSGDNTATTVKIGALSGNASSSIFGEKWVIGANNEDSFFEGLISGYSISKVGTGTLVLNNANTYSGGTTISNGAIMVLNTTGSATGRGPVNIQDAGTLSGTGIVSGATFVKAGGQIAPGYRAYGTLSFNSNVSFAENSIMAVDLNKTNQTYDQITVGGTLIYGGTLKINIIDPEALESGDAFTLFDANYYSGSFSEIIPLIPAEGLEWDLTELTTNGTIKVAQATGIANHPNFKTLDIYPNPSNGYVYFNLPQELGKAQLEVLDAKGNLILKSEHEEVSHIELNLSGNPVGIYFIKLVFDSDIWVGKIVLKQ